jgi:hypothetical protein
VTRTWILIAACGLAAAALAAGVAAGSSEHVDDGPSQRPAPAAPRADAAAARCDRVASTSGSDRAPGTRRRPYATPATLVRSLRAGQTGCLRGGSYGIAPMLVFRRSGEPGRPIELRSWPGERATLTGGTVTVNRGADHVVVSGLTIDGTQRDDVTVWVIGDDATISDNDITNRTKGLSCIFIGNSRWQNPPTLRTQIRRNRITDCGTDAHNDHDHGIYAAQARDAVIADNLLTGSDGWGVQLYPEAVGVRVLRNTIVGNGGGVIFAGNHSVASANNVVERNVISDARDEQLVQSYWDGPRGAGNVARRNCFGPAPHGRTSGPGFGLAQNVVAAPGYVAPARGDYRLGANSGCDAVIGSPPAPGAPASVTRGRR